MLFSVDTIDTQWLLFAHLLYSRYAVLWSERIRSVFQCEPHKSEFNAMLSENETCFLAPTPCCCIPGQPQKIPHRSAQTAALPGTRVIESRNRVLVRPAGPLWEPLRNCLPNRSPVIFLVLFSLVNRSGREGACSSSSAAQLAAPHHHNTSSLLLLEISILFVSWDVLILVRASGLVFCLVFFFRCLFFFSYSISSTFLPCSRQLISGSFTVFPRPTYKAEYETAWTSFLHRFVPMLWENHGGPRLLLWQQPQHPCPKSLSLTSCSDETELVVPHSRTPQPLWSPKARHYASLRQIWI